MGSLNTGLYISSLYLLRLHWVSWRGEGQFRLELNFCVVTEVFYLNKALALFNTGEGFHASIQVARSPSFSSYG
jgi:hypothetical protein